jgi:hypothetical protein
MGTCVLVGLLFVGTVMNIASSSGWGCAVNQFPEEADIRHDQKERLVRSVAREPGDRRGKRLTRSTGEGP